MSQAGQLTSAGSIIPGDVAIDYVTDFGIAVPAANILNVPGGSTSANNDKKIQTTGVGNTLTVEITNHITGSVTTNGAVNDILVQFPLGTTPGTFIFDCDILAYESGTPSGAGYNIFGTLRSDGASAFLVGVPDKIVNEDPVLIAADVTMNAALNTMVIIITGVLGLTINWKASINYTFVS